MALLLPTMPGPLGLVLSGLGLLVLHLVSLRVRAYARVRHLPGPWPARWTHLWLVRSMVTGEFGHAAAELHAQHGPVVCLAPTLVSLSDPEAIRRVKRKWQRGTPYDGMRMNPGEESLFVMRGKSEHDRLRAKFRPAFVGSDVDGFEAIVSDHIAKLTALIAAKYARPGHEKVMDLARLITYFTTDTISCLSIGHDFGCLDREDDFHGYLHSLDKGILWAPALCILPLYQTIMSTPWLGALFPRGGFFPEIMKIATQAVAERFGPDKITRRDMLGSLVAHGLSQAELQRETVNQLSAGSDTTSTTIRATLLHLLTTPRAYRRLQDEIDAAVADGRIGAASGAVAAAAEGAALPYLQAVIREGLRIFPPALLFPVVAAEDEVVAGYHIPAGTNVDACIKAAMRDTAIFGEDADVFRPERWTEADAAKYKVMEETTRIVWGGPSRWECLGKRLAMIQLNKIYIEVSGPSDRDRKREIGGGGWWERKSILTHCTAAPPV